jgi:hypothetical protein
LAVDKELRKILKGNQQAKCLKESLLYEEALLSPETVSIEIERTWIGKYCEYLTNALAGKESIYPYTKIWERIYIRIAENLENREEDEPEDLSEFDGVYDSAKIIAKFLKQDIKRRDQQLLIWDVMQLGPQAIPTYDEETKKTEEYKELEEQHRQLMLNDGSAGLLNYILGRNSSAKTSTSVYHYRKCSLRICSSRSSKAR